jgi:cellulose synthase/poly-beta-1,6-N-acetylglucosamine synthase-like glycosyltransferase
MVNDKMKISYIIPHNNREELLEYNLVSLTKQIYKNFEIIIIDNSINNNKIKDLYNKYSKILDIKLIFVDPKKHPYYHNRELEFVNPALQQNVGVKIVLVI